MILIYYKTWKYQCLIIQVKSPSIDMVSRPGLGSDPPFGSDQDSGRDMTGCRRDPWVLGCHIDVHNYQKKKKRGRVKSSREIIEINMGKQRWIDSDKKKTK